MHFKFCAHEHDLHIKADPRARQSLSLKKALCLTVGFRRVLRLHARARGPTV